MERVAESDPVDASAADALTPETVVIEPVADAVAGLFARRLTFAVEAALAPAACEVEIEAVAEAVAPTPPPLAVVAIAQYWSLPLLLMLVPDEPTLVVDVRIR